MDMKTRLLKQIEREQKHCESQEVGSEEYVASLYRLIDLEKQLAELEKFEAESERKYKEIAEGRKSQLISQSLEAVKIGSNFVLPLIGLVAITAVEKEITFTGALREYTKYFLPKKWN